MMKEAEAIVNGLNDDFYERTDNEDFFPATIESNGRDCNVMFLGFPVYQSDNDCLDEDSGQTLEDFIMDGVFKLIDDICTLKLTLTEVK